jgi:hypothetical protein
MRKISLTAIYPNSLYITSLIALIFLYSISALAKSNCDTNASLINPAILTHSGIGGTGTTQSGIGGTGLHDGGTGGTGNPESGIGGTGNVANDSGIGGTGTTHSDIGGTGLYDGRTGSSGNPEGGIGGTGNVANDSGIGGTGIIGVISGFASICVNGVEIHYDSNTHVTVDGQPSTVRDFAVGQVIAARAFGTGQELTARNVAVIHAAVGPISDLNIEAREMRILGQTVQVDQSRYSGDFSNLKPGDWVQVSGHRLSNGAIVASRIETTPLHAEARLNGYVTQVDAQNFEINGTRVHYDAKLPAADITQGMEVQVTGQWDGATLKAQHIQTEPTRQSIGNVEHVVIEGYVHALSDKELNLNNRIVTLDPNTQIAGDARGGDLKQDQRIQLSGRFDANQRINAERIELTKESPVQIQERTHGSHVDGGNKDKTNITDNESDAKSTSGNRNNQNHDGGQSNGRDGSLKKESDIHLDKDRTSGGSSHSKDTSASTRDEQKAQAQSILGDERNQSHGSMGDLKNETNTHSNKDHSSASEQTEKLQNTQDAREPNSIDYQSVDKPERSLDSGSSDRFIDHRDNHLDFNIPDSVRDHIGHHDRHIDR